MTQTQVQKMRNIIKYAIFLKFSRNVLFDKIFRPFDIRLDFQLNRTYYKGKHHS